jgi:crossover junction endodeoxyribonuclease RuvC
MMEEGTRILGIDPGSRTTGYGVINVSGRRFAHVASGALAVGGDRPLADRLLSLFDSLADLIRLHRPAIVSIEDVFYAQNVRSAITLGHARGAALVAAAQAGVPVKAYAAAEIKMAVAGTGRAEKAQVQEMVRAILGLARRPGPDAADALAAAICHAQRAPVIARIARAAGDDALLSPRRRGVLRAGRVLP